MCTMGVRAYPGAWSIFPTAARDAFLPKTSTALLYPIATKDIGRSDCLLGIELQPEMTRYYKGDTLFKIDN